MNPLRHLAASLVFLISLSQAVSANLIMNGGFEQGDATGGDLYGAASWAVFDNVYTTATDGPNTLPPTSAVRNAPVSHDTGGTQSLKMFGPFGAGLGAASGAYQTVQIVGGQEYELEAWAMNWEGDPFQNFGILQLTFCTAIVMACGNAPDALFETTVGGNVAFGPQISLAEQDGAEVSDWTKLSVSGVAPGNATLATVYLLHVQTGQTRQELAGSLYWDDVSLTAVTARIPEPTTLALMGIGIAGLGFRRKAK